MNIQWYPGHMTKTRRLIQENLKLVDVVIELVDARIPYSSKNPDMNELSKNKPRIIVINKCDLGNENYIKLWIDWYKSRNYSVVLVNSIKGKGVNQVTKLARELCKEKIERDKKRGRIFRPVRAMVVGIPNVGKSTFINKLVGKSSAKTGNKPGVTRGKQWIKIKKEMELLDTPGILWPKFEDKQVALKLAFVGTIKDDILDSFTLALNFIEFMKNNYSEELINRYNLEDVSNDSSDQILNKIAEKRGYKKAGNILDLDRTSKLLVDEFRSGKLGKLTLEKPQDI